MPEHQNPASYEHTAVPESQSVKSWHIALIVIGGTIAVPGFLMAAEISQQAGFHNAVTGFIVGGLILGVLGALTGSVGAQSKLTTYLILRHTFGRSGFKICTLITALVSLFWFAMIGNLFGNALSSVCERILDLSVDRRIFSVIGGLLMTAISLYGIAMLDKMARILVPVMAILLLAGLWQALHTYDLSALSAEGSAAMGIGAVASAVIGAYSGGIVTLPDYTRYSKSLLGGSGAIFLSLGISFPIVLTVTAIPSIIAGEKDLINILLFLGLGTGALIVLIFSTISSNCLMLYSSGLGIASTNERLKFKYVATVIGLVATSLSLFEVVSLFVPYISLLAICVPSLCGLYVCDFYLVKRRQYREAEVEALPAYNWRAFVAWGVGILTGYLSVYHQVGFTTVAAMDSVIPAAVVYWGLSRAGESLVKRPART